MEGTLKRFSVVNFFKEKRVAVVSSNWLDPTRKFCSWPVGPNGEEKLSENHPPEPDWKPYPCIFLKSYNSLTSANTACVQAKLTDELISSSNELTNQKTHRRSRKGRRKQTKQKSSSESDAVVSSSEEEEFSPTLNLVDGLKSVIFTEENLSEVQAQNTSAQNSDFLTVESQTLPNGTEVKNDELMVIASDTKIDGLTALVQGLLFETRNLQTTIITELVKINGNIQELLRRSATFNTSAQEDNLNHPMLPLESREALDHLLTWIKEKESNATALTLKLSYLGGRNLDDNIYRILAHLLSKQLAQKCSHTGKLKNSEIGLQGHFMELVYNAVRKNKHYTSITNSEVDKAVRVWIKNQKEKRSGNRDAELKKNAAEKTDNGDPATLG